MKKISLIFLFIFGFSRLFAQTNLVEYEYWFNNNIETRVTTTIAPETHHQLVTNIDVSGLPDGVNVFNIRYKDENNLFSSTLSKVFYKNTETFTPDNKLVQYTYWFNNDIGNAQSVNINPVQLHQLTTAFDVSNLPNGVNILNLRYKDENNVYSTTLSKVFLKKSDALTTENKLDEYEYWFNNDYDNKLEVDITPSTTHQLSTAIDVSTLPEGVNVFNLRYKDENDKYSSTLSKIFIKITQTTYPDNKIAGYQYWIDDDFASAVYSAIDAPLQQLSMIDDIDFTQIPKGTHTLSFRLKDLAGLWSAATTHNFTKQSLPIAEFTIETSVYCDSTVISTTNNSFDGDLYLWNFGDGTTSNEANPSHSYVSAGDYEISLTTWDTLTGADSTAVQYLTVATGSSYATFTTTTCDSYTSPSGNYTWTNSGTFYDTIPNTAGCDSILTIDLTILQSTAAYIEASVCTEFVSPSGNYIWNTSGIYNDTLQNVNGCDSVITIDLTILETSFSNLIVSACDSYTSPSGNYTWSSSGTYNDTLVNAAGCDSILSIQLTVYASSFATLNETACDSYISPSGNYTWYASGTYSDTISNVVGCDSILTIQLSIIELDTTVTINDPMLTSNAEDAQYQWLDCSTMEPVPGAIQQSFTAPANGWYAVQVTQEDCIDTSACYQIVGVDIRQNPVSGIKLYPNPALHWVMVDFGKEVSSASVNLHDLRGRLVNTKTVYHKRNAQLEINGGPGLYFLEVILPDSLPAIFKLIKD